MSKEGSRNVSLGPYRSTELALEERLTKQEAKSLVKVVESGGYGIVPNSDYSKEQLVNMLLVLGYRRETEDVYARDCVPNQETGNLEDRFVCISELSNNKSLLFMSGVYRNPRQISSDMEIIKEIYACSLKHTVFRNDGYNILLTLFSSVSFASLVGAGIIILGADVSTWGGLIGLGTLFGVTIPNLGIHVLQCKNFARKAENLSMDVAQYSFGAAIYKDIISDYYELTIPKLPEAPLFELPESSLERRGIKNKLESSEIKRLPEKKWAENQIGPETFVVSEATRKYFEKPESERSLKSSPAFEGPAMLEVETKK